MVDEGVADVDFVVDTEDVDEAVVVEAVVGIIRTTEEHHGNDRVQSIALARVLLGFVETLFVC